MDLGYGGRVVIAYANSNGSGETAKTYFVAQESGRAKGSFS